MQEKDDQNTHDQKHEKGADEALNLANTITDGCRGCGSLFLLFSQIGVAVSYLLIKMV